MRNIFLVDTENVNLTSLNYAGSLNEDDLIVLFLSKMTSSTSYNKKKLDLLNTKAKVLKVPVITGRKNSLDFQLVTYLGVLIGEHTSKGEINNYYIISKDQGYLASISMLNNCLKQSVELIKSISELYEDDNLEDIYVDKFIEQGFTDRTALKMFFILTTSKDFVTAYNKFVYVFNNYNIVDKCEKILVDYFENNINIIA
ncbi:MAG: PIN domain-containing protein [Terrisporobacter sp.]|uniref:PIN domain-containing protein n=1 Tax=Terrisporobacter sp. TaxID=1965305 RepID=UPI002FCAF30D